MSVPALEEDFGFHEWWRLVEIANVYEPKMRLAYTRAMRDGTQVNQLELRQVITNILARVCRTSAPIYGLVFNPNSPIYIETIDRLVEKYVSVIDSPTAREEVRRILPADLPLHERRRRLNTFGLDAGSAIRVEMYRQQRGDSPTAISDTARVRADLIRMRGNLLATTETNRVVNASLEALWIDNLQAEVSKAVVRLATPLPQNTQKTIVTRQDDRVCDYCEPLDGVSAKVGEAYDTKYGLFSGPPFHPRCRCFQILTVRARTR